MTQLCVLLKSLLESQLWKFTFSWCSRPSVRTIQRRLFKSGLKSFRAARKPLLSPKNIWDRIAFCRKYESWTPDQWKKVIFSDETSICQFYSTVSRVRRPVGQRYNEKFVTHTVKNAPKVMIWGAISGSGRCGLWFMPPGTTINGAVYLEILKEKVPPFIAIYGCTHFQHDGAPCHQTKPVGAWLQQNGIAQLGPWPGNSPDLNPIEHCWVLLKKKVAYRNPTSIPALCDAIKHVWVTEIGPEYCEKLCLSMPDRIAAVLRNSGKHTKF